MTQKTKTGALIFDETADRYDIRFDLADYYGGLHYGECMEVFVSGKWKPTRIEYGDNWYLVGVRAADLNGLSVLVKLFCNTWFEKFTFYISPRMVSSSHCTNGDGHGYTIRTHIS